MNKSALLFALSSAFICGAGGMAWAFDDDPGYGPERPLYRGTEDRTYRPLLLEAYGPGERDVRPMYYKPTMRYYGNGYTVSYRYVPVYRYEAASSNLQGEASNFRTEAFHLSPEEVLKWGANSPRVTVKDASSGAPRAAVTSIIRKKTTGRASKGTKASDAGAIDGATPAILPATPATDPVPAPIPGVTPDAGTPPAPKP